MKEFIRAGILLCCIVAGMWLALFLAGKLIMVLTDEHRNRTIQKAETERLRHERR